MTLSDAVEVVRFGDGPILITCEHASARLPQPWTWSEADRRLRDMHWAIDHGAADLSRELAEALSTSAVLARFSRMLIDPNRVLSSPTLFRTYCDGIAVDLNRDLSDREARIEGYYEPYHRAIDLEMIRIPRQLVFALHSFTPEYEGQLRSLKVGVLFDHAVSEAHQLREHLAERLGYAVALNEPWSGANGLMYAASTHGDAHGAVPLELEVRQDLLVDAGFRAELVPALVSGLRELLDEGRDPRIEPL